MNSLYFRGSYTSEVVKDARLLHWNEASVHWSGKVGDGYRLFVAVENGRTFVKALRHEKTYEYERLFRTECGKAIDLDLVVELTGGEFKVNIVCGDSDDDTHRPIRHPYFV